MPPTGFSPSIVLARSSRCPQTQRRAPIGVIKRVFGFAKVPYRGLRKNAHRLLVACALANLFIARRHLLRCDVA
jgi:hypothetical protein